MARQLRVDFPGARHHVMNRGLRHQRIFFGDHDAIAFLGLVEDAATRFGLEIHGFALMPNHYHLMIRSVRGNLSEAMRWLGLMWTQRLNRQHPGWDGPVFRGRFRSCVVDSERYWMHLLAYLHLNPVRGRQALNVDGADWTSHRVYLGESRHDWVQTAELRAAFGGPVVYRDYVEAVRRGSIEPPEGFERLLGWGVRGQVVAPPEREALRLSVPEAEALLTELLSTPWRSIDPTKGREGSPKTAFGAWTLHRVADVPQAQLARELGLTTSGIQHRIARVDTTKHRDPELWRLMAGLDQVAARAARVQRSA